MIDLSTATDAEILTWIRANLGQPRDRRVYCGDLATELRVMRMAIAETARRCDCEMRDDAMKHFEICCKIREHVWALRVTFGE